MKLLTLPTILTAVFLLIRKDFALERKPWCCCTNRRNFALTWLKESTSSGDKSLRTSSKIWGVNVNRLLIISLHCLGCEMRSTFLLWGQVTASPVAALVRMGLCSKWKSFSDLLSGKGICMTGEVLEGISKFSSLQDAVLAATVRPFVTHWREFCSFNATTPTPESKERERRRAKCLGEGEEHFENNWDSEPNNLLGIEEQVVERDLWLLQVTVFFRNSSGNAMADVDGVVLSK